MRKAPRTIEGGKVLEFAFFNEPQLPKDYVALHDGSQPMAAVQNIAICEHPGVDGFYIYYCDPLWNRVTADYAETVASLKRLPRIEFGVEGLEWYTA